MRKKTGTTERAKKGKTNRRLIDLPPKGMKGDSADAVKGGDNAGATDEHRALRY